MSGFESMKSKQGWFSLSTCLIDHKGRRGVLCKQVCYHLLGSAGIRQWHVIHVCVWVGPRRPKHLLWHRLGSEERRNAVFLTSSATFTWRHPARHSLLYLWRLILLCSGSFILCTTVLWLPAGLLSLKYCTFRAPVSRT